MKVLLLSCSTGEGHNHCARAVQEALDARGVTTEFADLLHMFGGNTGPLAFDKVLNRISSATPGVFGAMYRAGEVYSATGIASPVYLANTRYAEKLGEYLSAGGYDAVVCSHLFPMETLTRLRTKGGCRAKCYGVLSDYTCIPFLAETDLDGYFLPHEAVRNACIEAGMDAARLTVTGMPVGTVFREPLTKQEAREALGLPQEKRIELIMTGGIGCGDAMALCDAIRRFPDPDTLLCVLPGKNEELRAALNRTYPDGVLTVPFTDRVATYMRAADVLLSKAGGISSSEAAVCEVPLVHTMVIPGVETQNAEFFAAHGMSCFATQPAEAARFADRLVFDRAAADRMLAAQRACVPKDGAERIADAVMQDRTDQTVPPAGTKE